jgi:GT2 family glycosyltransferase
MHVLSYNRLELLVVTLQTIKNTEIPYELYIIDASTDKATLELLRTQENVIYYPGSNVGQATEQSF